MPRSAAALSLSASSQSPIASSASIWFDDEQGAVDPVPAHRLEPRLPQSRRLSGPSQHRQRVGEIDVRSLQAEAIADLLGELQGLTKMGDTLLAAAEVGEVAAEHGERSDLRLACADIPSERERLLADRQRLRVAPGHHQRPRERPQRIRALRRGRLRRHELDRALERGEASVVRCRSRARYSPRRTWRSAARCGSSVADELDRSPAELDRARGGADLAGELGRPGAELGEVEPGELGRVRHRVPQRERPLEVRERLRQAEDGLRLACRFDRRGERLGAATRRRPVRRELGRRRGVRCARAPRRAARAAPRARRAGSSRRSPPPGARGGSGSCRSPARRRGRRARPPGAATRARRAPAAPPTARSSG